MRELFWKEFQVIIAAGGIRVNAGWIRDYGISGVGVASVTC